MRLALEVMNKWCKKNRHMKLFEPHAALCRKVTGHYAYYGITGNFESINNYRYRVVCQKSADISQMPVSKAFRW